MICIECVTVAATIERCVGIRFVPWCLKRTSSYIHIEMYVVTAHISL